MFRFKIVAALVKFFLLLTTQRVHKSTATTLGIVEADDFDQAQEQLANNLNRRRLIAAMKQVRN
jgi:hypothetical protein